MTGNEYQALALRTCDMFKKGKTNDMLLHAVFGLNAEAGEVAGIFQKEYQGHIFDRRHLEKELGDCLWMIAEAASAVDLTLEQIMETNIEKLKARYPNGFEAEKSLHRKPGDI